MESSSRAKGNKQCLTKDTPFQSRTASHPLSTYLFDLMLHKKSNLCLSADVTSASTLLSLAESIGPSIVVLKTHYDIVSDWNSNSISGTGAQLAALARRHGFLIFEDRKFSDIGSTVQKQYVAGPGMIVEWAHITNAHILPGKAIVTALGEAARSWRQKKRFQVRTEVSVGTPRDDSVESSETNHADHVAPLSPAKLYKHENAASAGRKASIVSITTVSQHYEDEEADRGRSSTTDGNDSAYPGIAEAPLERGLLLLAQMSSAGNLLDAAYTEACVAIARENKDFVMGYIAQQSLNTTAMDDFVTMTPGVQLPPEETESGAAAGTTGTVKGDGLGQQYNTPDKVVGLMGADVMIVGRGIINAIDPIAEAARYRVEGWKAYEARVAK